jgi:uncharacterized OB-fold protein
MAVTPPTFDDEAMLAAYPREPIDHDTKHYYRGLLEHRLLVNRCDDCGWWHTPPAAYCPQCWSGAITPTDVSGSGHVYYSILLHQGPVVPGVDYSSPYPVATIELDEQEGLRVTAPIVHCDTADIRTGMPVSLTWIDRAGVPYPAFEPEAARG